jgi:hypothetical protein
MPIAAVMARSERHGPVVAFHGLVPPRYTVLRGLEIRSWAGPAALRQREPRDPGAGKVAVEVGRTPDVMTHAMYP